MEWHEDGREGSPCSISLHEGLGDATSASSPCHFGDHPSLHGPVPLLSPMEVCKKQGGEDSPRFLSAQEIIS